MCKREKYSVVFFLLKTVHKPHKSVRKPLKDVGDFSRLSWLRWTGTDFFAHNYTSKYIREPQCPFYYSELQFCLHLFGLGKFPLSFPHICSLIFRKHMHFCNSLTISLNLVLHGRKKIDLYISKYGTHKLVTSTL